MIILYTLLFILASPALAATLWVTVDWIVDKQKPTLMTYAGTTAMFYVGTMFGILWVYEKAERKMRKKK